MSRVAPRFRTLFAAVITVIGCAVVAQVAPTADRLIPVPAQPLTVEEAVAIALQNNPAIVINTQNVQIAQQQVNVAQANGRPTVGVNATTTYVLNPASINFDGQQIQTTPDLSVSAQAVASQPLWPSTRWRAPVQAARANVGLTEQDLVRTREQVAFQTRQDFFQLLSAQDLLQVAQYSVEVGQTQLRLAEATFNAGTAPRLDVEQARATLADAQVGLARAQNSVDISRATLATQMGLPAGTAITIVAPPALPAVPVSVDPLVQQAYANRPELIQLNFRRQQIRANMDLIRLERQPVLNGQAAYGKTLVGGSLFGSDGLTLSANLAFNLYNGGRTKAELAAAQTQLEQVDTVARQLQLGISLEVRQAWLNLQNAQQQLTAARQEQVAADEALRIAQLRYENGEGILLEVEQARLRSTQARTALSQARFQAQVAAAQLEFAIGAPPTVPAP